MISILFCAVGGRKYSDFIFYMSIGIIGGCIYVFSPVIIHDGNLRSIGSIRAIIRLGIVMGVFVFFGMLFRSQRN